MVLRSTSSKKVWKWLKKESKVPSFYGKICKTKLKSGTLLKVVWKWLWLIRRWHWRFIDCVWKNLGHTMLLKKIQKSSLIIRFFFRYLWNALCLLASMAQLGKSLQMVSRGGIKRWDKKWKDSILWNILSTRPTIAGSKIINRKINGRRKFHRF